MSNPDVARAIQCGSCQKLYPDNDGGRALAEKCCTCKTCKMAPSEYTGQGTNCRKCHAEEVLAAAKTNLANAEQRALTAQAEVDRLNAPPPPKPVGRPRKAGKRGCR